MSEKCKHKECICSPEECECLSAAQQLEARYKKILEYAFEEIYIFDACTAQFIEVSPNALKNLGYTMEEMSTMIPVDVNAVLTLEGCKAILATLASGEEEIAKFESKHKRKDGSLYDVEVRLQYLPGPDPAFVALVHDVTERNQHEAELRALAFRDPGTDLYNKRFFKEQVSLTLDDVSRREDNIALILIDMDNFSDVNNEYGHVFGDEIIAGFAKKIKKVFSRKSDIVARFGGDEFVVLCTGSKRQHLLLKCQELIDLLNTPCYYNGIEVTQTASIGLAICEHGAMCGTAEQLIESADAAMYDAKAHGKNTIRIFRNDCHI